MNLEIMILKDQLAMKFAPDGIFYDATKQVHFKLLKKAGKGGPDCDEWDAEKMQKSKNSKGNKDKYVIKECNLREFITVSI